MSIKEFDEIVDELKSAIEAGDVNTAFDKVVLIATEAQKCNKKGLEFLKHSILFKKKF